MQNVIVPSRSEHNLHHEYSNDKVEQWLELCLFAMSHTWEQEVFGPFDIAEVEITQKKYIHIVFQFHKDFFNSCEEIFKLAYMI